MFGGVSAFAWHTAVVAGCEHVFRMVHDKP